MLTLRKRYNNSTFAIYKRIFMEVKQAKFITSSSKVEQCPKPDRPEYAFIGRSNVGKSSLINMLTSHGKLAKVSSSPGKTTLINHFLINGGNQDIGGWYLVDLPGYGYAKRSISQRKEWEKMIERYFKERENLLNVFVLIDSRITPQMNDLEFLKKLTEWNIPFSLIFTKSDKSNQSTVAKNVKAFIDVMKQHWQFIPAKFVTSAEKGHGRKQVLQFIEEMNQAAYEED